MASISIDPKFGEDLKALKKHLEQMSEDIKKGKYMKDELSRVWNKIKQDAVLMCPKDTGTLAGTIRVVPSEVVDGLAPTDKSITMFDRAIIAGDLMKINPKTHGPVNYAQIVHDGYVRKDGAVYVGIPFLTYALALNEGALESAVGNALDKLCRDFSDDSGYSTGGNIGLELAGGALLMGGLLQATNQSQHKNTTKKAEKSK